MAGYGLPVKIFEQEHYTGVISITQCHKKSLCFQRLFTDIFCYYIDEETAFIIIYLNPKDVTNHNWSNSYNICCILRQFLKAKLNQIRAKRVI